ncbi:cytochrome P450 [Boletus edulis]|nr:cytochrome P450 [Boletus edulis]
MSPDVLSSTIRSVSEILAIIRTYVHLGQWRTIDAAIACATIWILLQLLRTCSRRLRTTQLRGPPSESFLYGVGQRIRSARDAGALYEAWAQEYGPVYAIPSTLGTQRIMLCDPKAIAHFHSKESRTYIQTPFNKESFAIYYGKGLLWAHGEDHRRQRKSLTPAFSVAAIRQLTTIFYDSAYKAKDAWDVLIESSGGDSALIEVQSWMNHISLDTIGLAGFSHNFGALEGKHASVTEVFDTFTTSPRATALNKGLILLGQVFPLLAHVPTSRTKLFQKLNVAMEEISNVLLAQTKKELEMGVVEGEGERSIIGLLIKGASGNSGFRLTKDEVIAQMKLLLVAAKHGGKSHFCVLRASIRLHTQWALLELSRHLDVQTRLRNELLAHGTDPTYDQLTDGLPYLDAVVHEVLRIHLPILEVTRVAVEDDVIPLSQPIRTKFGKLVNSITIAKGTLVAISMESMNRSAAFWGEDAKVFRPSRWLEDKHGQNSIPAKAKEIPGHRHLLTFVDGPRACLGKNFALTEFKAVLTVLVKNYVFELRDGVDSKIEIGRGVFPRPKLAGEVGCQLPLRARPYVASG